MATKKAAWLWEGDLNAAFFHAKATTRARTNQVHGWVDKEGNWCDTREGMEKIVSDYFTGFFGSSSPSETGMDAALQAIEPRVTDVANHTLSIPFTANEVTFAQSHMFPLKSPDPNGFPVLFYKNSGMLLVCYW